MENIREFTDIKSSSTDKNISVDRGEAEIKKVSQGSGGRHEAVAKKTGDPNSTKTKVEKILSKDTEAEEKLPGGIKAFFNRHPVARLLFGGAIVASGVILEVAMITGGVLGPGALGMLLLALTAGTGGIAVPILLIGLGVGGGLVAIAGILVGIKTMQPGVNIAYDAVVDMKKWSKLKKHLKAIDASDAEIEKAHKYFHSPSRIPLEIVIQHDKKLSQEQKTQLLEKTENGKPISKSSLYVDYEFARLTKEIEESGSEISNARKKVETDLPGISLFYVAGSKREMFR